MEYQFEYFTSERSEIVRCKVEQEKRYSISTSNYALFFFLLYIRPLSQNFRRLPKILHERFQTISANFRRFAKIREDCRRLSRKIIRCFDHMPKNLITVSWSNIMSVKSSISSVVRMWKIPDVHGFLWILRVVHFQQNTRVYIIKCSIRLNTYCISYKIIGKP